MKVLGVNMYEKLLLVLKKKKKNAKYSAKIANQYV